MAVRAPEINAGKAELTVGKVQYFFTVEPLTPRREAVPRTVRPHVWAPPKVHGDNVKIQGAAILYHNGNVTRQLRALPAGIQLYKQYSMYYDHACIWLVDLDAANGPVGDGRDAYGRDAQGRLARRESSDSEEDSDSGEEDSDSSKGNSSDSDSEDDVNHDWSTLTFNYGDRYCSYAGRNLGHSQLCVCRPDQLWASWMIPGTHQPDAPRRLAAQPYGGLNGELPVLLGLMALAVPANHVVQHLSRCIANTWRFIPPQGLPAGQGCKCFEVQKNAHPHV